MNGELFDKYPILRKFEESDYVCLQCIDSINDSVKVCTKYAKALKSEIYDKKANVNNDADQKEDEQKEEEYYDNVFRLDPRNDIDPLKDDKCWRCKEQNSHCRSYQR
eukprot:65216_1